jgi:hypothetical protein
VDGQAAVWAAGAPQRSDTVRAGVQQQQHSKNNRNLLHSTVSWHWQGCSSGAVSASLFIASWLPPAQAVNHEPAVLCYMLNLALLLVQAGLQSAYENHLVFAGCLRLVQP